MQTDHSSKSYSIDAYHKKDSLSMAIQEDNNIFSAPDASIEIEISTGTTPKPIKDTKSTLASVDS